jgi:hypothetical protein
VFVRLEAIRTEKHQTWYQPLQPYIDQAAIVKHVRPWQQMLMFFACTQKEHTWKSPKYWFTRRQREAWEALIGQAEWEVDGEEVEEVEEEEEEEEEETDEETIGEMEEAMEEGVEEEEGQHLAERPEPIEPKKLSRI